MRYRNNITFCADGGKRLPARRFVSVPDTAWIGRGTAFGTPKAQRRCTLLVVWHAQQEEPWIILTDLPPEAVGVSWYALRFWIELGFKAIKSLGWKWDKTRRTDPTRVSRHWLVLSVATLLALAYGTRAEDAHDRRIAPGNLRAPPKSLAPQHRNSWQKPKRKVSVFRHGIDWLRRLMHKGRLWNRVWLLPEPWPKHKPNLEITCHAPPLKTLYIPLSGLTGVCIWCFPLRDDRFLRVRWRAGMRFRKQQYPRQPGCLAPKRCRKAISIPSPQYLYIPLSAIRGGTPSLLENQG